MADAVVGALRVVLGADTAAFETGLKNANKSLEDFGKGFEKAALAASGALALAVTSMAISVKGAIDQADQLGKASQKFGVPVEQLSALKFAADLADVSFESLGKGLGKLSKAIIDGAVNPSGEGAKSFKALGISVRDSTGNIKETEAVFTDIAEKFANMQDGAGKTALAIRLFGKSGAELIPLLNEGADGLKKLTDEAAHLGLTIDKETAAKAEKFNDTLKRIHAIQQALAITLAADLLPTLQKLADIFLENVGKGNIFSSIARNLVTESDIQNIQRLVVSFENLSRILTALKSAGADIIAGNFTAAFKTLDDAVARNQQRLDETEKKFKEFDKSTINVDSLTKSINDLGKAFGTVNLESLAAKNAFDQFIESQKKHIAQTIADADATGKAVGFKERFRAVLEGTQIAQSNNIVLDTARKKALDDLGAAAAAAAQKLAGAQITQEMLTPWEQYQKQLENVKTLLDAGAISQDTFNKKAFALQFPNLNTFANDLANVSKQVDTFVVSSLNNMSTAFVDIVTHSKSAGDAWKAFGDSVIKALVQMAAQMLIILPIAKALKAALGFGIPGLGPIGLGLGGIFSFAQGGSIKALGAAGGLSMKMPGGLGATDSMLMPLALAPGERVDVTPASHANGQQSVNQTIIVQGVNAKDYYRGDVLRDFVNNLNEAIGDGLKIKVA